MAKLIRPFRNLFHPTAVVQMKPPQTFLLGQAPLDLEIGCGVGLHPLQRAQNQPLRNLIAIEHTKEKFEKFESRLKAHASLPNLFSVHANAVTWISEHLPAKSVDTIFFMYPNPNPKNKAKRWIQMPFMGRLLELLKDSGQIVFVTNVLSYAEEIKSVGVSVWKLEITKDESAIFSDFVSRNLKPRTHFEKKYLERGQKIYEIHLKARQTD